MYKVGLRMSVLVWKVQEGFSREKYKGRGSE